MYIIYVIIYVVYMCCVWNVLGEAQPADITIQRQIKIHYKREFQKWLTDWTLTQLKAGLGMYGRATM